MKKIRLEINDEAGLYGKIELAENGNYIVTLLDLDADVVFDRIITSSEQKANEQLDAFVWEIPPAGSTASVEIW